MPLRTGSTVIYGLGERFDGNLRKRDLAADTPYNTYTHTGCPDWYWVLIGPRQSPQLDRLLQQRNVFWLGEKSVEQLPAYLPGLGCGKGQATPRMYSEHRAHQDRTITEIEFSQRCCRRPTL